jgi:hypothetical protein
VQAAEDADAGDRETTQNGEHCKPHEPCLLNEVNAHRRRDHSTAM